MTDSVILIGPVAPFRGGIARHSNALARGFLDLGVDLSVESFARLYPRWLYPGADDRIPDRSAVPDLPVNFDIDSLNPLSWRRAARRIAARRPALVVIPAWTFFVAPALGTIARILRRQGIRVAMVVHNVGDHDGSAWKRRLIQWQLDQADVYITHGPALAAQLRHVVDTRPIAICSHPPYNDYPDATGTLPREKALEMLCFGLVRSYKGVDIAIAALAAARRQDVRLTVAGEIWEDAGDLRRLAAESGVADQVEFIPHYVSDQMAAELFQRSDLVLAPYREVTGSGVLALARHYRRPVVASDLPGFSECIEDGSTGWLVPPGDVPALANLIANRLTRASAAEMGARAEVVDGAAAWKAFADTLLAAENGSR